MNEPCFRYESSLLSVDIYGKGSEVAMPDGVFSLAEGKGPILVPNRGETVVALSDGKNLIVGSYMDKDLFALKVLEDFKGWAKKAKAAYIFAGTTFSSRPAQEGEFEKLEELGYLECAKITGGMPYVDLPLMAFLQLRKSGLETKDIHVDRLDCKTENLLYSPDEGKPNVLEIRIK